ncbi:hypothetical protein [Haloarchaeobius sp. TZWWS8]|uniref:hypothetical protein n=1 Tax=Haloarchaeobius sp. TZWWS8 TaxID=3446121 RepID=UPI003EB9A8D4
MEGDQTPIPPYAEKALAVLQNVQPENQVGIDEQTARSVLQDAGFVRGDIASAIEVLELRGYIYRVDGQIRITD